MLVGTSRAPPHFIPAAALCGPYHLLPALLHLLLHPGRSSFLECSSSWLTIILSNTIAVVTLGDISIHLQTYSSPLVSQFFDLLYSDDCDLGNKVLSLILSFPHHDSHLCSLVQQRSTTISLSLASFIPPSLPVQLKFRGQSLN